MRFTVLTATYNRAHTLHRVYESLCAQTFRDFEWLIVDDGSTDETRELVRSWKAFFPIRYLWKANGGKHTAWNLGVASALGEFVVSLDSDDCCIPTALERFDFTWKQIPDPKRFAVLAARCCTPSGEMLGKPYPAHFISSFNFKDTSYYLSKYGEGKDGCALLRTDIARRFPFPEGERFVLEALVWNRIFREFAVGFLNEALLVVNSTPESLSKRGADLIASSPKMAFAYYWELFLSPLPWRVRLKAVANLCRLRLHAGFRKLGAFSTGPRHSC